MATPFPRALLLLLVLLLALPGCRREVVAPGDPVAAVQGLAKALHDDDLVRYSKLSMPPALHKRVEQRWHERLGAAAPATATQAQDYARWMQRFTAADAEEKLYARFDKRMRKIEGELGAQWPLMQATGGIFLNGLIKANDKLSPGEKQHAKAVGTALLAWLSPQLVADRARAKQAIAVLVVTARELDLPTLADTRKLELNESLEKGGVVLKAFKQVARIYGLDANAALAGVQARALAASGDTATMEVSYPLMGKPVRFEMQLLRRDGRWYPADAVRQAETDLARPLPALAPAP
ncbi:MAG: hypothetical protein ABI588_00635 [Arenimonas sp.]